MNGITAITLFVCLMLLSLAMVSYVNKIQARNRLTRAKMQQYRMTIESLEETCMAIEPLLESVLVPKLLYEEILRLVDAIEELDANAPLIEVKRESARKTVEQLTAGKRIQPLNRALSSDTAIAQAKYHLTAAGRCVRRQRQKNTINETEMESFLTELTWARLMVNAVSHLNEGYNALKRGESAVTYGHYLRAQNALMGTHVYDEKRRQLINEINTLAKGKSTRISAALVPELGSVSFTPPKGPSQDDTRNDNESRAV